MRCANKHRYRRPAYFGLVVLVLAILAASGPALADELSTVFQQLLANPDDPSLNIRYAELVEARGERRKALAAYERALARHPDNAELKRGYLRVKRRLQPRVTTVTLDTGISWETNPRQLPSSDARREEDITFDLRLLMFDERTLLGRRWRTLASFRTQVQGDVDDLTDARATFASGPVFEVGDHSRLHVAPGAAVAWLDGDWLYVDTLLQATFETLAGGATQSVTALFAYRDTNSAFLGDDGVIIQVTGRLATYNKLFQGDAFYVMPRFRYSEPSGDGPDRIFSNALFPGNYVEVGGRLVYYAPLLRNRVYVGAGFGAHHRSYDQNVAFGTADRRDWLLEPTAHLVLRNVRGSKFDLRVDYRYEHNDSNDRLEDFDNHVFGVRTVRRF